MQVKRLIKQSRLTDMKVPIYKGPNLHNRFPNQSQPFLVSTSSVAPTRYERQSVKRLRFSQNTPTHSLDKIGRNRVYTTCGKRVATHCAEQRAHEQNVFRGFFKTCTIWALGRTRMTETEQILSKAAMKQKASESGGTLLPYAALQPCGTPEVICHFYTISARYWQQLPIILYRRSRISRLRSGNSCPRGVLTSKVTTAHQRIPFLLLWRAISTV